VAVPPASPPGTVIVQDITKLASRAKRRSALPIAGFAIRPYDPAAMDSVASGAFPARRLDARKT